MNKVLINNKIKALTLLKIKMHSKNQRLSYNLTSGLIEHLKLQLNNQNKGA